MPDLETKAPPDPDDFCHHCNGKGSIKTFGPSRQTGQPTAMTETCLFCEGTGKDTLGARRG